VRSGVVLRTAIASMLLALVVGAAFAILIHAIDNLRESGRQVTLSREESALADGLEMLVIDLETGSRGFVITRQERFLEPWTAARAAFPKQASRLADLVTNPDQARRVRTITRDIDSYINDYSVPLVNAARQGSAAARSVAATEEGKRRVDALRAEFGRFQDTERTRLNARQRRDDRNAARAATTAGIGLAASVVLILLFGGYLTRAIAVPLRRTAAMAGRLAGGDLAVRVPETGIGEVGALERAFNRMGGSLEASHAEIQRLADEQAALRRVATLVAQTESTSEIFEAVTREVGLLCGADLARMERYESDGTVSAIAAWSGDDAALAVATRFALEGPSIAALVRDTHQPARVDSFEGASGPIAREAQALEIRSSVGCPIVVGGRTWGVIAASTRGEAPFPTDTESQIGEFTELVATAVSNAQARAESSRLNGEQAALRRVATLVAQEAPPGEVFTAVADELAQLLDADTTMIARVDPDEMMTIVARSGGRAEETPFPGRWTLEQPTIVAAVVQTGGSVRIDDDSGDSVATPVHVAGRVWGATIVATQREPLTADAEQRMADFTELVATAIANADARAQLIASRARVLTAGDDARRRVVRDLHDGAQQRLVTTIIALKLARQAQQDEDESADALLVDALEQAEQANAELRELAHGLLPPVLARGGLQAGVNALVSRLRVPVDVDVSGGRLPPEIEASAYFVVAEALTNVVKHSRAQSAQIKAWLEGGELHLDVRDDGVGGARADGTGLLGLHDRLASLGGRLQVESPPNGGTRIAATLPL
jgi:signal transduction histidine kinase/CHASE3 domain sensor protein